MNICQSHKLIAIAAMGENREIGKNGGLCFKSDEDMEIFKSVTMGQVVIMGRKTLDSIRGGKGLKNRLNIVLTRDPKLLEEGTRMLGDGEPQIMFESTVEGVMEIVESMYGREDRKHSFIVGGAEIYDMFKDHINAALISNFDKTDEEANTFLPKIEHSLKLHESRVYNDFILEYYVRRA